MSDRLKSKFRPDSVTHQRKQSAAKRLPEYLKAKSQIEARIVSAQQRLWEEAVRANRVLEAGNATLRS